MNPWRYDRAGWSVLDEETALAWDAHEDALPEAAGFRVSVATTGVTLWSHPSGWRGYRYEVEVAIGESEVQTVLVTDFPALVDLLRVLGPLANGLGDDAARPFAR